MQSSKHRKIRLARDLIRKQDFDCPLCGRIMTFKTCNVDHIIPRSRGGSNARLNLRLTHVVCNRLRGNKLPSGLSESDYPVQEKHKRKKDAYTTTDYTTAAMKKRMTKYYEEVDARYQEIHTL